MTDLMPRLKPARMPLLAPVPEHAATGALAEAYVRTKSGLQVPWVGVVAMVFAQYPVFYGQLWSVLEPLVGRDRFISACKALRETVEIEATALSVTPLAPQLQEIGYDTAELEDIRACIEVFADGNMPYILMATLARSLLEGAAWETIGDPGAPRARPAAPKPPLMEPHHATLGTQRVFEEIKATLGLPFVNTDYRALARWPSYFALAWADVAPQTQTASYEAAVQAVHAAAVELCAALPNMTGVTPAGFAQSLQDQTDLSQLQDVVRLFQWLLPGLAMNVALFQAQLKTR